MITVPDTLDDKEATMNRIVVVPDEWRVASRALRLAVLAEQAARQLAASQDREGARAALTLAAVHAARGGMKLEGAVNASRDHGLHAQNS